MGIALPWEQAVCATTMPTNQPMSLCTLYDCACTPLLKGPSRRLISSWHMRVDPRFTFLRPRTLPAFFGNNRRKNGELPRERPRQGSESLPSARRSRLSFSSLFFILLKHESRGLLGRTHVRRSRREFAYLTEILVTGVSELLRIPRPEDKRDGRSIKERSAGIRGTNFYTENSPSIYSIIRKRHEFFIEILME